MIIFADLMDFLKEIDETAVNETDNNFCDGYSQAVYDIRKWVEKHRVDAGNSVESYDWFVDEDESEEE